MSLQQVTFAESDLRLFAEASWDLNPLHMSSQYARTTPYGEQVVFGVLGALYCLSRMEPPSGYYPAGVTLRFRNPMLLNSNYSVIHASEQKKETVRIMDGSKTLMEAVVTFSEGAVHPFEFRETEFSLPAHASVLSAADMDAVLPVNSCYQPSFPAYEALLGKIGVPRMVWGDCLVSILMLSSYAVGMHIPGENALFYSARIELTSPRPPNGQIRFRLELRDFDKRMDRAILDLRMFDDLGDLGSAELEAFVRPSRTANASAPIVAPEVCHLLDGKLAIVVGASRGLGASLALSLAARGARVIAAYSRSDADARAVQDAAVGLTGEIVLERADCGKAAFCEAITAKHIEPYGGLDILVCCAAPSIAAMHFEPEAAERILSYVQNGLQLVCQPLCAWMPSLKSSSGRILYVSSSAVEQPVVRWPQYVAMKAAGEGLIKTALLQFPAVSAVIARPGKILTDLINTSQGKYNAEDPMDVAERLISALATPSDSRLKIVE